METHKTNAFLKFFLTYFVSVALLILTAGFFYFQQMKSQLVKAEHFSLIEYARHIKMGESLDKFSNGFHYKFEKTKKHIDIRNFKINDKEFIKYIPTRDEKVYMKVFKSKQNFILKLTKLKYKIIFMQIILLSIFGLISYFLAKNALKPLQESIKTLDSFAKDLIHDLNTPVTAMNLNIKLLQKQQFFEKSKPLQRLKKSVDTISELRVSLTTLLEKRTFQITQLNICSIVKDVIELHEQNFPNIHFEVECSNFMAHINKNGFKQILHNLISNSCKYNREKGSVYIYIKDNKLYIKDNGIGIDEPEKIFTRTYSKHNSTGFGLDIVRRLCEAMNISIEVISDSSGSCFSLEFKKV